MAIVPALALSFPGLPSTVSRIAVNAATSPAIALSITAAHTDPVLVTPAAISWRNWESNCLRICAVRGLPPGLPDAPVLKDPELGTRRARGKLGANECCSEVVARLIAIWTKGWVCPNCNDNLAL